MARHHAGAALLFLGVVAMTLGLAASPVHASAPDETGWWFKLKTKALPVPVAVPVVPEGGLFVQQGVDGPTAYGAIRARVAGAASATLVLTAAQGSTTTLGAPLQACEATKSWASPSAAPGDWEDAPTFNDHCTFGAVSSDGKAVAFFFEGPFFHADTLDIVIVPQAGAPPFAIAFDKPSADSLTTRAAPVRQPTPSTIAPANPPAGAASSGSGTVAAPPRAAPTRRTPSVPSAGAPAAAAPAPAPASNRSTVATDIAKLAGFGDPDRGERMASLGGASAIVIGWWLLTSRSAREPQLLGALAGGGAGAAEVAASDRSSRTGGVGRFARPRTGNATSLR